MEGTEESTELWRHPAVSLKAAWLVVQNLNALKWTQHKYALKILSSTGPGRKKSVSVLVEDLDLDLETAWPGLEITFLFWDENLPNVIKSNSACEKGCQDLDQKIFRKDSSFVSRS